MSHKLLRWFSVLTLTIGLLMIPAPQRARAAGPWYVATTGDDSNDCLSPSTPCATINGAITKASPGDTVTVGVGIYTGIGNEVILIDRNITLSGGWDETFTTQSGMSTVDGEGARRGITSNSGITSTIEHLIIYNCISYDGGSGIYNGGTLTLTSSSISGNTWDGVYNHNGILTLTNSSISGNTYSSIYSDGGVVTLNNSTVANNGQTGIQNINGMLILNNSTLSGNLNGGIFNYLGTVTLNNSTISSNISQIGGSSAGGVYNAGGSVISQNSIVAGNIDAAGVSPDCNGNISSSGYNLIGNTSGCIWTQADGDLINVDPLLGPLQDNGGPTFTHALLPGSPAIDAGNPAGCTDQNGNLITTDQRGIDRPQGGGCDIGAFEVGVPTIQIDLDIKPGNSLNRVNLKSEGVIPVAVLTSDIFDATTIDKSTVRFGVTGEEAAPVHSVLSDVDNDGDLDMLFHFNVMDTGLRTGDNLAYLTGKTVTGEPIKGSDSVNIVYKPTKTKSSVIDLGTLGGSYSYPQAINDNGQVIGTSQTASSGEQGFFWQNGVMTALGPASYPYAINSRGQVVGSLGEQYAFFWQNGVMTNLGTLGGCCSSSWLINAKGQAAGYSETASGEWHPFFWQNGVMTDMGTLGGFYTYPTAINGSGQVIGGSQTASGEMHAFFWQIGVMTDLGTLGGFYSYTQALNERGQVIGYSQTASGEDHAFFWENGVMTDLGTLGGFYTYPTAINGSGQVIGYGQTASGDWHTFLWQNGVMADLGTLGGFYSYTQAINERGQVIGNSQTASGEDHAFFWENGVMTDLGTLGGCCSYPFAMNERGQVIGWSNTILGEWHAFLWQKGAMIDLANLGLISVTDINDHGLILGTTYTSSGEYHAALLKK